MKACCSCGMHAPTSEASTAQNGAIINSRRVPQSMRGTPGPPEERPLARAWWEREPVVVVVAGGLEACGKVEHNYI